MSRLVHRSPLIPALAAACSLVVLVGASDGSADRAAGATARAWAIKVIVPGQPAVGTRVLVAPEDAVSFDGAFADPADGSVVAASSVTTSVSATSVTGETHASAGASSASGDTGVTAIVGLVVLGQPVTPTANQQIPLADW